MRSWHDPVRRGMAALLLVALMAVSTATASPAAQKPPLVVVIATGGTIANTPAGRVSIETLLEEMPEIADVARIEVIDYIRVGSQSLTIKNLLDIATIATSQLARKEVAGVVITQGSNSSDETAYFMSLLVKSDKPVVVVAAQRQRNTLSEDGSRNFLDAIRVAGDANAQGFGAIVVVNQMIHPARDVKKVLGSGRVEAWQSGPDTGAMGLVDTDRVVFYKRPLTRHTSRSEFDLASMDAQTMPVVDIVYSYLDADGFIIDALVRQKGVNGLVIAAFLTGSPAPLQAEAIARARQAGVAVVTSTRGWGGRVSGISSSRIGADNLSPGKARILLMLALTVTRDAGELQRIFDEY